MASQKAALKNAITQILSCALQPHSNIQRLTEERKKACEMTEDYSFILLEIIESKEEAYAEKHMAATFLKNYVVDSYTKREIISLDSTLKEKLSLRLIGLLSHENDIIRQMISLSLELLVVKEYPNLFAIINNRIMQYLLSDDVRQVRGAVQFMRALGDNQRVFCSENMYFSPEYIEPLLNVLHNDIYPMSIRAGTVSCMVQILISCRKTPLFPSTKLRLIEVFKKLLSEPYSHRNNFQLRSEIIITISQAVDALSGGVLDFVSLCLPSIGQIMYNCCVECKNMIIERKLAPCDLNESEPEHFQQLIMSILILINKIFVLPNYSVLLTDCLDDFMYLLFILMCTYGNLDDCLFIEDEIDTSPEVDYSLRGRCSHTLMVFMDQSDYDVFCASFHRVIQKHLNESNLRGNFSVYDNRMLEALMYGIGLFSFVYEPSDSFLIYIETWSSMFLEGRAPPHWIVLARLLWLGSKYGGYLTPVTLSNHLSAILANYNGQNQPLRIACLDALRTHLCGLSKTTNRIVFSNVLQEIVQCLFSVSVYTPTMAVLGLQSMGHFFEFSPASASRNADRIFQIVLDSLQTHISDATVIKEVKFLLSKIVKIDDCKPIVRNTFIPFTIELIFHDLPSPSFSLKINKTERGFDLLNTVIKFYPDELEDEIVIQGFLGACNCILDFQDSSVIEIATIFITNLLMKSSYQVKTLREANKGKNLAEYVPTVLFKLLEPHPHPVCPSKFGRLCVVSIMTLSELMQPCIESILKALLTALQRTNVSDPVKSYCFIFAYMCTWQTESIINFLSGIPGPDGRSALSYFLNKWQLSMLNCEKFEKSISTLAICKMIQFSLTENDDRINDCTIVLEPPYKGECTGLEKLYLALVKIFLSEFYESDENDEDTTGNNDVLIKNHPVCDLNLVDHIKNFIRNYDTYYYYNIVKKYVQKYEPNFVELERNGIKPSNL